MTARRRIEIPTTGTDEALQLVGSDPFGSMSWVGLRVPFAPTAVLAADNRTAIFNSRYLFLAAAYSVAEGEVGRIIGYRQLITIGTKQTTRVGPRFIEQLVTSPFWHFQDGNVSFHLHRLGPPNAQGFAHNTPSPHDLRSLAFRYRTAPALLYEKVTVPAGDPFYVDLTSYLPPNGGKPWGTPLSDGHQGTFYDQRTPWRSADAWTSLDMEVEGPDTIALFISVSQTNPDTRPAVQGFTPATLFTLGLSPEEQFLLNFPDAIYWRVGGALIVEVDSVVSDERELARPVPVPGEGRVWR